MHIPRIFCAIDAPDLSGALDLTAKLKGTGVDLKLGLEFFIAEGPRGIDAVRAAAGDGVKIFLDLKLHDIPNTVAGAVRSAMRCRADYLTLHAGGGGEMMRAAVLAAAEVQDKTGIAAPVLLGVTVLTHMDAQDLHGIGVSDTPADQVARLAVLAKDSGMGGAVCSPQEIARLRALCGAGFALVVPGIRPAGSAAGDQKRIMTPQEAAALGADALVIGRPITEAKDPARAAADIVESLRAAAA
ncbi:MAG: orotidine-5'-phosphate decarboxylase [Alphaproteobacteria bacterium]|nr:orotidine-5'-phosphate decarboxylase [Alphaproteobacteria bacterium]